MRDNLGRNVGSIALRYSGDFIDDSVAAQGARLLIIGVAVVLGMAPFSIFGAMLLLRRLRDDLQKLRESVDDVTERRWDGKALGSMESRHPEFAVFAAATLAAHHTIDQAIGEIRRLDEEEAV